MLVATSRKELPWVRPTHHVLRRNDVLQHNIFVNDTYFLQNSIEGEWLTSPCIPLQCVIKNDNHHKIIDMYIQMRKNRPEKKGKNLQTSLTSGKHPQRTPGTCKTLQLALRQRRWSCRRGNRRSRYRRIFNLGASEMAAAKVKMKTVEEK